MTWAAEFDDIVTLWEGGTTIPAARRHIPQKNDERKDPPEIDTGDPDSALWARLTMTGVPNVVPPVEGATSPGPLGIGPTAPNYREGLATIAHFYPKQFGDDTLHAAVDETRGIFHRASQGIVRFRDVEPVMSLEEDDPDFPEWKQVNQSVPYYVIEVIS